MIWTDVCKENKDMWLTNGLSVRPTRLMMTASYENLSLKVMVESSSRCDLSPKSPIINSNILFNNIVETVERVD